MDKDHLNGLVELLAVAEERSFTRAAQRLGVSPSALSHAVRSLEERVGVRLLARTTRSVAPTYAGSQFIARVRPALGDVEAALAFLAALRDRPAGRLRLVVSRIAAQSVLAPRLARFAQECPDVTLDVITDERRPDLVAEGFDAGIHLGEFVEKDMVAIRVSADRRAAIVGAPSYFASHPRPVSPRDLPAHTCLNFRHGADVYRWEFEKGRRELAVSVSGPLIVDDVQLMIRAALDGVGLAFVAQEQVGPELASGALVRVLESWCPSYPGFFLYYPSRRQQPAALSALIAALRPER